MQQQMTIQNAVPDLIDVVASASPGGPQINELVLRADGTTNVYVRAIVTDANGCNDLDQASIVLHRSDVTATCDEDETNCYHATAATFDGCTGVGDTTATFELAIPVQYDADPTDEGSPHASSTWLASVTAEDLEGHSSQSASSDFDVRSLAVLEADSVIDFGTILPGQISTPKAIRFTNKGNRDVMPRIVSQGDMACGGPGSLPIQTSMLHMATEVQAAEAGWSVDQTTQLVDEKRITTSSQGGLVTSDPNNTDARETLWDTVTAVSITVTDPLPELIPKKSGSAPAEGFVIFALKVPSEGVHGVCSNTLNYSAIAQ